MAHSKSWIFPLEMAMFHSYVAVYQRVSFIILRSNPPNPSHKCRLFPLPNSCHRVLPQKMTQRPVGKVPWSICRCQWYHRKCYRKLGKISNWLIKDHGFRETNIPLNHPNNIGTWPGQQNNDDSIKYGTKNCCMRSNLKQWHAVRVQQKVVGVVIKEYEGRTSLGVSCVGYIAVVCFISFILTWWLLPRLVSGL